MFPHQESMCTKSDALVEIVEVSRYVRFVQWLRFRFVWDVERLARQSFDNIQGRPACFELLNGKDRIVLLLMLSDRLELDQSAFAKMAYVQNNSICHRDQEICHLRPL